MRLSIVLSLLLFVSISQTCVAQRAVRAARAADVGWEVLGSKKVSRKLEKDVLRVGANDGGFTKLKIKITGGTVKVERMVVTYANGAKDEIPVRYVFKPGEESRVIDLRGGKRIISKIAFVYDRNNLSRSAKVWVSGRK